MVQYVCEACKGLYESVHFKNSLEIVLTVGNMMNASIKKTGRNCGIERYLHLLHIFLSLNRYETIIVLYRQVT